MTDPIRVISRIKNNRLMQAREDLGLSCKVIAERAGISYWLYLDVEGLRRYPSESAALKLSAFHGISVEILFPEYLKQITVRQTSRTIAEPVMLQLTSRIEARLIAEQTQEKENLAGEVFAQLQLALSSLTPRQREVIKMRYGLEGRQEHTLEQIAQYFCVSKERIRQVEARALRDLRHPSRSAQMVRAGVLDLL